MHGQIPCIARQPRPHLMLEDEGRYLRPRRRPGQRAIVGAAPTSEPGAVQRHGQCRHKHQGRVADSVHAQLRTVPGGRPVRPIEIALRQRHRHEHPNAGRMQRSQ